MVTPVRTPLFTVGGFLEDFKDTVNIQLIAEKPSLSKKVDKEDLRDHSPYVLLSDLSKSMEDIGLNVGASTIKTFLIWLDYIRTFNENEGSPMDLEEFTIHRIKSSVMSFEKREQLKELSSKLRDMGLNQGSCVLREISRWQRYLEHPNELKDFDSFLEREYTEATPGTNY